MRRCAWHGKETNGMKLNGVGMGGRESDRESFGGKSARIAAVFAAGVVTAVAAGSAVVGAVRIDQLDRSSAAADFVAGIALFASAILVAVVALARTRLAAQEAEIERLRAGAIEPELRSEWSASDEDWSERMADPAADRSAVRISER
jgi:hypothetical protein